MVFFTNRLVLILLLGFLLIGFRLGFFAIAVDIIVARGVIHVIFSLGRCSFQCSFFCSLEFYRILCASGFRFCFSLFNLWTKRKRNSFQFNTHTWSDGYITEWSHAGKHYRYHVSHAVALKIPVGYMDISKPLRPPALPPCSGMDQERNLPAT